MTIGFNGKFFDLSDRGERFQVSSGFFVGPVGRGIEQLRALGGDDTLLGSPDPDALNGNQGNDLIYGDDGGDRLLGGQGADTLIGDGDNDALFGNRGNDLLDGGTGNDFLRGGRANDTLMGGDGDDTLIGDLGSDMLMGGPGRDVFVLRTDAATDNPSAADRILDWEVSNDLIGLTEGVTLAQLQFVPFTDAPALPPGAPEGTPAPPPVSGTLIQLAPDRILGFVVNVPPDAFTFPGINRFIDASQLVRIT